MEVSPRSLIPSSSAVKSRSLVTLTVVSFPPQLHCPSIWSVTPAPTPSDLVQQISLKPSPTAVSQFSVTLTVELLPSQYNCLVTRTVSPVVRIDLTKNQANSMAPQTAQMLTVPPYRSKRIFLKSTQVIQFTATVLTGQTKSYSVQPRLPLAVTIDPAGPSRVFFD